MEKELNEVYIKIIEQWKIRKEKISGKDSQQIAYLLKSFKRDYKTTINNGTDLISFYQFVTVFESTITISQVAFDYPMLKEIIRNIQTSYIKVIEQTPTHHKKEDKKLANEPSHRYIRHLPDSKY